MSSLKIESRVDGTFQLPSFMGLWHVTHSTLSMWRKGQKFNPRIEYHLLSDGAGDGMERWTDQVLYEEPGNKQIHGVDTALEKGGRRFRWRGNGWLCWVKCDCEVSRGISNQA